MLIHGDHRVFGVLEQAGVACASILLAIELGHVGHRQDRRDDPAVLVSHRGGTATDEQARAVRQG